jgi:hypothetical protein
MMAFTRLIGAVRESSRGVRADEIAVAFICDRILPGSFAHSGVLATLVDTFPAALIWYGLFAALSLVSGPHQASSGLVTKLERDLLETFSFEHRPRCDICLEELEVLSRASMRSEVFKASQQRSLLVALLPGVDVYSRLNLEGDAVEERTRREAAIEDVRGRVSFLLEEALHVLKGHETVRNAPTNRRQRKDR